MHHDTFPEPYWWKIQLRQIHAFHFSLPSFLEEVEYGKLTLYQETLTKQNGSNRASKLPPASWSTEEKSEFGSRILTAIDKGEPIRTHIILRPIIYDAAQHDEIWNGFNELQVLFSFCDMYPTQEIEIMIQPGMPDIVGFANINAASQRFQELRNRLVKENKGTNILN